MLFVYGCVRRELQTRCPSYMKKLLALKRAVYSCCRFVIKLSSQFSSAARPPECLAVPHPER